MATKKGNRATDNVVDFKNGVSVDINGAEDFTGRAYDRDIIGVDGIFYGARRLADTKFKGKLQENYEITMRRDSDKTDVIVYTRHGWAAMVKNNLEKTGKAVHGRVIYKDAGTGDTRDNRFYMAACGSDTDAMPEVVKKDTKAKK